MSTKSCDKINIDRAKTAISDFTPRARYYDHYLRTSPRHRVEQAIIELGCIDENDRVLDLACGTGFFLRYLQPSAYKCGVDICQSMLMRIPEKCNARAVRAHACMLPFHEDAFDVITCLGAINVFDDNEIELVFSEVKRVLDDHGRFIINSPVPVSAPRWQDRMLHKILYPPMRAHSSILSALSGCKTKIKYVTRDFYSLTGLFKKHFKYVKTDVRDDLRRKGFDPCSSYGLIMGSD
jgi:ubiquinone/menaquinone biosynthesis C-methylase UbiE